MTFEQPLWWNSTCIVNDESPESDLKRVVLRLGAFHTQMRFLGSIGHIMKGSGVQEALELIYAHNAVSHILSGKAVQGEIHGHFLVNTPLNALLLAKEYKIPLEAEKRADQLECQSVDENNATESTETLESRYETQQFVWLLSMPITAEVRNAMQKLTEIDYTTSEQHKDMSDSRIKWDMKDTKTILEFMEARDPFSEDSTLRSIVTGVIADNRVNVDKAKEVGQNILKTMAHKNTEGYTFKINKL